ncbi:MAG: PD-(D/E)XK nuclease family protein [Pleurocapsa sp.]
MHRYIVTEFPLNFDSHVHCITPTKAIAKTLKTPHHSLETLAQTTVNQQGWIVASSLLSRRLLQKAVTEIIKTKDIKGTAAAFLSTIQELFRSGIDLIKLQQQPSVRIQQLASLAINYQQKLRSRNCLDRSELFWHGAKNVQHSRAYVFYGYFAPNRDELTFLNAVAGHGSIIVLPKIGEVADKFFTRYRETIKLLEEGQWQFINSSLRVFFSNNKTKISSYDNNLGKKLQKCFFKPQSLPPKTFLHCYRDQIAEVRGVLTQVKVLLDQGIAAKDIVLVAKNERGYGATLIDVAWEYHLSLRALYEIPVEQTPMGAWLKLLLEVIENNFPFEATAKLLFHPLVRLMGEETWSQARQTHPQSIQDWKKLGIDLSLLDFPRSDRRDGWWKRLQDILAQWQILEHGQVWGREVLAYYGIQAALVELAKPAAEKISRNVLFQDIKDILALLTIPAQPGNGGVELHTPNSLWGTTYQYVFVLGMGDGIFPSAIAPEPILDYYDRHQLVQQGFKIATAVEIAQTEAFTFYNLLGIATKSIIFSYPQSFDRQTILPSPYLSRLGLQPSLLPTLQGVEAKGGDSPLPLASIETARQLYLHHSQLIKDPLMSQITKAWQVETNRESSVPPDEYDGVMGIAIDPNSKIFSASQLTQLGQCPFKWFASRLLKLKELPEAELDLSTTFRGNLYHRCLELSLAEVKTASDLEKFNRQQLEAAFCQAEQELELTQLPGWDAQRQEHLEQLYLNLIAADFLPPDREVFARETKFDTQWYGLQVQGKIDRIDRTATGLTILDYKTSSNIPAGIKDETGKANIDIQLPLYTDAIAQTYPDIPVDKAIYYSLSKNKAMGFAKKDPERLAAFAQQVKSYLEQGYYPVNPDRDRQACKYCAFDGVCRQGNRLSRKFNTNQWKRPWLFKPGLPY